MNYTYEQVPDTTLWQLTTDQNVIFILDETEPAYTKMLSDFQNPANIEKFVGLLNANPSTAYTIYNGL